MDQNEENLVKQYLRLNEDAYEAFIQHQQMVFDYFLRKKRKIDTDKKLRELLREEVQKELNRTSKKEDKSTVDKHRLLELNLIICILDNKHGKHSNREVAELSGLSEQTVSEIFNKALRKLRAEWRNDPDSDLGRYFN
jgi:DNA-directed RNA polymerase sigma subunit (sigma70/sigma32)